MNHTSREAHEHAMIVNQQQANRSHSKGMVPIHSIQAPNQHEMNIQRHSSYTAPHQRRMPMDMSHGMPPGPMNNTNFNGHNHMKMPPVANSNMHTFHKEAMKHFPPHMNQNDSIMKQQPGGMFAQPNGSHNEYILQQRNNIGIIHSERIAMPMRGFPPSFGPSGPRNINNRSVCPPFFPNAPRFRQDVVMMNMNRHAAIMNSFNPPGSRMPCQMGQHMHETQMNHHEFRSHAHDNKTTMDSQRPSIMNNTRPDYYVPSSSSNEIVSRKDSIDSGVIPVQPQDSNTSVQADDIQAYFKGNYTSNVLLSYDIDSINTTRPIRSIATQCNELESSSILCKANQISPSNSSMQDSTNNNQGEGHESSVSLESYNTAINDTDINIILENQRELDAASILCSLYRVTPTSLPSSDSMDESHFNENMPSILVCDNNKDRKNKYPTRLALPSDERELNTLHCFLRKELLELFVVNNDHNPHSIIATVSKDDEELVDHYKNPFSGRAGLRCVFCTGHVKRNTNASMRMFYPRKLSDLYKMVSTWQRVHFAKCQFVPTEIREKYNELKAIDKSRGKKSYWLESAKEIGLTDDEKYGGGLRFVK